MSAQQIAALQEQAKAKQFSVTPTKTPNAHGPSQEFELCICNRQLQDILCRSCGYIFVGRQRRRCTLHPNAIHLMDATVCPKCRTNCLIEIKTSRTPLKKKPDELMTELTDLRQRRMSKGDNCEYGLRTVSTSCSTDDEDWEKEYNSALSSMPSANGQEGTSVNVSTMKEAFHSDLKYNSIKSPDFSKGDSLSTNNPVKSPELKTGLSNMRSDDMKIPASQTGWSIMKGDDLKSPDSKTLGTSSKHNDFRGFQNLNDNCQLTRETKTEYPNSKPGTITEQRKPAGAANTGSKMVDSEVQTEFVIQVLEEPKFCHQNANPPNPMQQRTVGYGLKPKMPVVSSDSSNSILKAAIKRSIMGGWNNNLDKMNDLCIGERRF